MPPTNSGRSRPLLLFAAASMLLMNLVAGLFGVGAFLEIAKLSGIGRWPVVDGTIVSSAPAAGCQGAAGFSPQVSFRYEFNGLAYSGQRIDPGAPRCGTEGEAESIARRYPAGSRVAVHVNPSRPAEAVLETAADTGALWFMGLAALVVGGAGMAWVLPRLRTLLQGRGNPAR